MPHREREKAVAAAHAVALVRDGMRVGLGTGSTAAIAVRLLGERVRNGLSVVGIPTSERTRSLAEAEGIEVTDFMVSTAVDLTIDGCDEADRERRLVKGGGGALLREKVVASVSRRVVIIADSGKLVERLGRYPLPVEAARFAWPVVQARLRALGAEPRLRTDAEGRPFLTDEGHYILDADFGVINDPQGLSFDLLNTPGVVDHGLFVNLAHELVIGRGGEVDVY